MKQFFRIFRAVVIVVMLLAVAIPYWSLVSDIWSNSTLNVRPITNSASEASFILDLLKIALTTCAFIAALYSLYSKDTRLRASGELLFISLLFFAGSTLLLVIAMVLSKALPIGVRAMATTGLVTYSAILLYVLGVLSLIFLVFLPTYNQLYNLKTDKAIRRLKPIRLLKERITNSTKRYELKMQPRQAGDFLVGMREAISRKQLEQLGKGGSILLLGIPTLRYLEVVSQLILERLKLKETANYVCTHRPPAEVWEAMEGVGATEHQNSFVFIDAYSPNFAFTDDIHKDRLDALNQLGVKRVLAKSLAGLHTATNIAFNVIKELAVKAGTPGLRAPMLMVYDHTSVLCDLESIEQFSVFWRHVIPSERAYGMVTLIIEDDATPKPRTDVLRQLVDVVVRVSLNTEGDEVSVKILKDDLVK